VREESVDPVAMRAAAPEAVKAIFDLQIHTIRHGTFENDVQTLTARCIPPHKAPKEGIAWEIAERGPMKLLLADIHLHRARLFFREAEYPWGSPGADLAPPRASSSRNAATDGARRNWRMPSGRLAGAEIDPLLAFPLRKGEVGGGHAALASP
jgi:hypothetical protein